jgi:hypothetical protein
MDLIHLEGFTAVPEAVSTHPSPVKSDSTVNVYVHIKPPLKFIVYILATRKFTAYLRHVA